MVLGSIFCRFHSRAGNHVLLYLYWYNEHGTSLKILKKWHGKGFQSGWNRQIFLCGKVEGNAAKFMNHDDICLLFFSLFLMSGQGYSRARTTTESFQKCIIWSETGSTKIVLRTVVEKLNKTCDCSPVSNLCQYTW